MTQNPKPGAPNALPRSTMFFEEAFLRKLERLALLSRQALAGQMQGERRSPKRGQSVEFADFRPYSVGDDFRRIDWNAYARLERFFIKLFVEEEDLTVHLLVDASRSMAWGQPQKLDYAIRAAAALGYVGLAGLDRVTATALGSGANGRPRMLAALRGKPRAVALFDFLARLGQDLSHEPSLPGQAVPGQDAATHLRSYAANAPYPGPLALFSDLLSDGWESPLSQLAGRGFEVTLVHLLSPQEIDPQLNGDFKLLDSENGAEVEITADYELLARYKRGLEDWQAGWRDFCRPRGIHYVPLSTSVPLEDLLFAALRRSGVLR